MSSASAGFPDWQRITEWFGAPLEQAAGRVIGAGAYVTGPFNVRNFASVVICVKPTGGNVTVKVTQQVPAGPVSLAVTTSYVVVAGNPDFHSFVLLAGAVTVEFDGTAAGETIDYAIVPSNVNTAAEVSSLAQVGFQHNEAAVGNETAIDFVDANGLTWTLTDDPGATRVKVAAPLLTRAAALPGAPTDGQLHALDLSATFAGVEWLCMYKAATGFWDVLGGPPLPITGSTTGSALANHWYECGFVAVPNAGDYIVHFVGGDVAGTGGVQAFFTGVSIAAGVPGGLTPEAVVPTETARSVAPGVTRKLTGFTAGQHASLMFNSFSGAGGQIESPTGLVYPVRIQ